MFGNKYLLASWTKQRLLITTKIFSHFHTNSLRASTEFHFLVPQNKKKYFSLLNSKIKKTSSWNNDISQCNKWLSSNLHWLLPLLHIHFDFYHCRMLQKVYYWLMSDWQYLVQQLISLILTKPHSMPVWISDRKNELTCPPPASNSIFRFVPAEKSKCLHSSRQSYEFSIFPLFHSLSVNFLE